MLAGNSDYGKGAEESESTVRRGVRDLQKAGFLTVEERFRWNHADSSNKYILLILSTGSK